MAETKTLENPEYKGIAGRKYQMSVPSQGEIFLESSYSGEPGRFVPYQRVGDKIQRISFDPNKIYSQFNVGEKARMDNVKGIPAYYDKSKDALIGVIDRYGREEVLLENASQQFGGTPQQYNLGDVRRFYGDAGWAYDFTPMETAPETPEAPSTTLTTEGAESYTEVPGFTHEIEQSMAKRNNFESTQQQLEQARSAATSIGKQLSQAYGESDYAGGSVVDYLKSLGKESSYSARENLAKSIGITDYRGTAEQNTKLLSVLRGQDIPSYDELTKGGIQQDVENGLPGETLTGETPIDFQQRTVEDGEEPIDNIVNKSYGSTQEIQSMQDIVDMLKEQFQEAGEGKETAEQGLTASFKKLMGLSEDRESMQDVLQQQYEEWGIPENFEKIQKLGPQIANIENEIANIKAQKEQALMQSEQRQAPMSFIRGEKALVERQYNSKLSAAAAELGAKQSLLQAYQGNISMARNFVSDTVNALTYDTKQARQDITDFMSYYSDQLTRLSNEEQTYFSTLLDYYNTQLDWERSDYQTKLNMAFIEAPKYGVDLGLSATDIKDMSLEEVASLYSSKVGPAVRKAREDEEEIPEGTMTDSTFNFLNGVKGPDGYVSPEDYRGAKMDWMNEGLNEKDFDRKFVKYVNPADPQDYNLYTDYNSIKGEREGETVDLSQNQLKSWAEEIYSDENTWRTRNISGLSEEDIKEKAKDKIKASGVLRMNIGGEDKEIKLTDAQIQVVLNEIDKL